MKHKYQGLKVSKLWAPFNRKIITEDILVNETRYMKPIEPIFNRYGWYHDRNTNRTWIESEHGCWEDYDSSAFFRSFRAASFEDLLPIKVSSAIKLLIQYNICPKELKKRLSEDLTMRYVRKNKYKARKRLKHTFINFKKE